MHTDLEAGTPRTVSSYIAGRVALVAFATLLASGCAMNETQQRTGTGAAIGAIGGALIGTSRESAAIGAAVGAAGGFLFDQYQQRSDAQAENAQLRQENARLQQQSNQ
jgi:hypothetical protein